MKKVDITFNIDPYFFGSTEEENSKAFAYNLCKNIQKIFMIRVDYDVNPSGNNYQVRSDDPHLELEISEYIENNWVNNKTK